jgi:cytochrome c5
MKKLLILLPVIATIGCFSKKAATPAKSNVDSVATVVVTPEMANYNQGKLLYQQNCKGCHVLIKPSEQSEDQWRIMVPVMTKKVNKKEEYINPHQQELILNYVLTAKRNNTE